MGNLYDTILSLCNDKGIRPGRLCDELGLSRGLMTDLKMERKKTVNAQTAQKIAAYFAVSEGYLLGEEENRGVLEEVDIAFYGDFRGLSQEDKENVRTMVRLWRSSRGKQV